ncbi:asparagine synthase (glutamine-hydrolyzing) [Rhodopseudomonas boonkerdii]|uniref:asparagine synthase (glutamine-hydrolyzing) n=1 Tax=Rhodopseudomonas boonkerdii TaxID=475937 RepID=UPI0024C05445|nr:asparagine synthase (glutamine-hydrolyzing) [Rhodopseudomonas boonkerdii]UGV25854.1 asparagine synthase (glutamine-hydrolyzing) [Rhodopseudomonas boonkerdii]
MCGIAGLLMPRRQPFDGPTAESAVRAMLPSMQHRGPDGDGVWQDPDGRCVLGQLRLAIIDTSPAGLQPFPSGDGRWWITFNGEIYSFKELKPQLERAGVNIRGRTDTEVLVESIALWGTEALPRLDGMFAFAAFDTQSGETILARDPFGEKPLYYMHLAGGGLAFASELQAMERVPGFDPTVDIDSVAEVLSFQYIGAPRTIYQHVRKLPPGHWMRVRADGMTEINRYFRFEPGNNLFVGRSMADLADELEDILVRSLQRRMIADVPLGAFLSGGVDSSTTCALIRRRLNRDLKTYSMGFSGAKESEHNIARAFAAHLGTEHHEELIDPKGAEFLYRIGEFLDEPNADSSCFPTYLLSQFARKHVTVAISGDGGDEMFGGYGRYFATLEECANRRPGTTGWHPGDGYYGGRILIAAEAGVEELLGFVPTGFAYHLAALRGDINASAPTLLSAMRRSDVDNYMPGAVLPKVDRMSMQHSLEVRTPFLNVELARFAERLPENVLTQNGSGKLILKEIAYRYLPRELIDLPKQGFGLPMSDWAKKSLLNVASKMLSGDESRLVQGLGHQGVNRFLGRQRTANAFSSYQVWAVAMLESWLRKHPVKWPALEGLAQASARRAAGTAMFAHQREDNTWIVTRHGNSATFDAPIPTTKNQKAFAALFGFQGLAHATTLPIKDTVVPIQLPEWNEALNDQWRSKLAPLANSQLFFVDVEERENFDYAALSRLADLGVRKLISRTPYSIQDFDEINLKKLPKRKRALGLLRLWRYRIASAANRRLARVGLKSMPFSHQEGQRHVVTGIRGLAVNDGSELAPHYALFEGTRQLPPLQFSHTTIADRGGGRYSIRDSNLYLSSTEQRRLLTRPYWLVEISPASAKFLSWVPARVEAPVGRPEAKETLRNVFQSTDGDGFELQSGDSFVVITHALPPGGAERQWIYLAQSLAALGYKVTFVTYESLGGANGHYLPMLEQSGITLIDAASLSIAQLWQTLQDVPNLHNIVEANLTGDATGLLRVMSAIAMAKPRAIFAQLDHPNVVAAVAGRLLGIQRIVVSFRNYNPTNFPYLQGHQFLPNYKLLAESGAVRFTSNFSGAGEDYADWIGIDRSRVSTIPNAVDIEAFHTPSAQQLQCTAASLGLDTSTPTVLGVFRLSDEKDPFTFIEVCRRIVKDCPSVRIFIAGMGPLWAELEQKIQVYGLANHVSLLGRRDDVYALMTLATLLLLTSTKEGMPNVVVEAQALGTAVVATNAGAVPDIIEQGKTGFIRPVGDAEGLAADCLKLLSDMPLAKAMGEAGRHATIAKFPKSQLAASYLTALA